MKMASEKELLVVQLAKERTHNLIQCECTHREKTVCIELDRERREKGGERAGVLSTMGSITW